MQLSNDQLEEMWETSFQEALTNRGQGPYLRSRAYLRAKYGDEIVSAAARAADAWVKNQTTPAEWRSFQNDRKRQKRDREMVWHLGAFNRAPRQIKKDLSEARDFARLIRQIRSASPRPT